MTTTPNGVPPDIHEVFGNLFGELFGVTPARHDGPDITLGLRITDDEAAHGAKREIAYKYAQACVGCGGRGSRDPEAVRIACKGCNGAGTKQVQQGFFLVQTACATCHGERESIANPCGACAGAGKTLVEAKLAVIVPPDVQPGTMLRIPERGNADLEGKRGFLYVKLSTGADAMVSPLFGPPQPQIPRATLRDPKASRAEMLRWVWSIGGVIAFAVLAYLLLKR